MPYRHGNEKLDCDMDFLNLFIVNYLIQEKILAFLSQSLLSSSFRGAVSWSCAVIVGPNGKRSSVGLAEQS